MEEKLLAIADEVIALSASNEQIEVIAVHDQETDIRVYKGELESFTASESQGVGIRVVQDGRQGMAYAGSLDMEILKETLSEARDNATFGTFDEMLQIAEPDNVEPISLDLYNPALKEFATEDKIALAKELEEYIMKSDERIVGVESSEYVDSISASAIVTSSGIRRSSYDGGCYIAGSSLASDGKDMQTGFGYSVGRDPAKLEIEKAGSLASERATRMLGAQKASSGRKTVVLDPYVTAQFLGIIGSTFSGESLLKGRSLFADRENEKIAAEILTLIDDPTDPDAFTASEVDGEGLASRRNVLIEQGVLNTFLHNSYTARSMGTQSTGSAVRSYNSSPGVGARALAVVPGTKSQQELIGEIDDGILIQGVSGLHSGVNPVSGDFSAGAEGLLIKKGQLSEPVREITIASTLQRMLLEVLDIGNDLERLPMRASGVSLVVADVTVSGV